MMTEKEKRSTFKVGDRVTWRGKSVAMGEGRRLSPIGIVGRTLGFPADGVASLDIGDKRVNVSIEDFEEVAR